MNDRAFTVGVSLGTAALFVVCMFQTEGLTSVLSAGAALIWAIAAWQGVAK